jgi:prepilin-type N-terminal cleavage/methylation domain-containing protein
MLIQAGLKSARIAGHLSRAFTLIEVMMAFVIFGLVSAGVLYGYVQANRIAEWSAMSLGAQSYAVQGIELARAAKWDTEANGEVTADFWPATNNNGVYVDWTTNWPGTNDVPQSGAPLVLTNYIQITQLYPTNLNSTGPFMRQIVSQAVWRFPLTGKYFTNTVTTLRAPDQ